MKKILYLLLLTVVLVNCKEHHKSNITKIKQHTAEIKYPVSSKDFIQDDSLILADVKGHEIFIRNRKKEITSFNCSECHSEPLKNLASKQEGKKKSHWNIELNHSDKLQCSSCHNTEDDLDYLRDINDSKIDFNHSYKLCAQCHSDKFKSWKGGAHGKRLSSWAPPRVSYSCVECHNPHSPSFEKRLPSRHLNNESPKGEH